ncbi:MAG: tetratricopeptide repeat protein [Phycisphaerae bacterium]
MNNDADKAGQPIGEGDVLGRLVGSEEGRAKARKLFAHAQKAESTRSYEYAIELYVQGLAYWPDAIEEGLKKLWYVGTMRLNSGGKPPGFMAARKFPTGGKDPVQSLNNALHLFGLNPTEVSYMEQVLRLGVKTNCDAVVQWIAPILATAYKNGKKLSASRYQTACEAMDRGAELAIEFENEAGALDILRACVATAQVWAQHHPDDAAAVKMQSDASGKLAIVKGRFAKAEDFTDSLKDGEAQHDIQDREKRVHTVDRTRQLIEKARLDWEANRNVPNKLLTLADLIARIETDEDENEAIKLLEKEYAATDNYVFKQKADDLRMRQLHRHRRALAGLAKANPDDPQFRAKLAAHEAEENRIETAIFEDRQQHYPTDLRVRFQLGVRYFQARRYDDAIPLFQQARADARVRAESRLYIGRCFYEKHFYDQAIEVLRRALDELEDRRGGLALALNYWLARSLEASGDREGAQKTYGFLIQLDYNYRDARRRMERLVAGEEK